MPLVEALEDTPLPRRISALALTLVFLLLGVAHAFPSDDGIRAGSDAYSRVVHQVFYHVEKKYVEPGRASPKGLLKGAFKALETQYPQVLVNVDEGKGEASVRVDDVEKRFDLLPANRFSGAADVLNVVLSFVSLRLSEDVEKRDVYYVALNGALSALDPHSNAFSPEQFKEFMIGTRGSFGGIGFVFGIRDGDMTIITPIDGTPADRGGLRSGDKIIYIDGEPTINMPVDVAANKMRGEPGTQVTLTIARDGWTEPRPITFTREIIHVDSVESFVLNGDGGGPALYAKVKSFQKDTTDELRKAVKDAEARYPDLSGLILDFRNDPGGLLDQAIALADGFMERGTIVSTRGPEEDSNSRAVAQGDPPITKKPVVLLVNQGSASASEIVAGALKSSRALLIGQKTFGKGSVQKLYPLTDGGALKLTVAQYLTPGDVSIQSIGVQPDIAAYPAQVSKGKVRLGPPPSHVEEADLENAFKDWGNASEKPWREIQYLGPEAEDDDNDKKSFAELSKVEKVARVRAEFEVRLAQRILARSDPVEPARSRDRLFKVAEPVLEEMRKEEDAKIAKVLADQGVDWTEGKNEPKPKLSVRLPKELKADGGTTQEIPITVRNDGARPVYRIWGRTDSTNPLLKNLDFAFGRIDPGKERTATAKVEVPKSAVDRWDTVTLELKDSSGKDCGSGQGSARIGSIPAPKYAYSYEIRDENPTDRSRSGDGILEEGERVQFILGVRNRGSAASPAVDVNIRGDDKAQLYLETARRRLEGLAVGEKKDAPMAFRIVKAGPDRKATLTVSLSNREYSLFLGDTLKFQLGKPYTAREARTPPDFEIAKLPPLKTSSLRLPLDLRVVDDEAVKDAYAYLGDKKIYYGRNRAGGGVFPVRLDVPLEPGSNRLVVIARDQKGMTTSRTFFLFRAEAEEVTKVGVQ